MNNLKIISMDDKYAGICGITKEELLTELKPEIQNMADYQHITFDETVAQLKEVTFEGVCCIISPHFILLTNRIF